MSPATQPQSSPQVLVGRTIRMMRETHRVGLRELAALVGVSPSHLSRIENGERALSHDLELRICNAIASLPIPGRAAS